VFSGGNAFLVDFDWAGKCGEAFYPTELVEGMTKYCEGKDLDVIEKEHNLALLNHYFPQKYTTAQSYGSRIFRSVRQ